MPENREEIRNPLVSVVMPAFNCEKFLAEAIESVLGQDYRPLELIIINDGSKDQSGNIARSYCRPDGSVRLIELPNGGPSKARNRGMEEARGDFIAFIDSDDLWLPEKISKQMMIFAEKPEIGVVYSQRENIDERGTVFQGYKAPVFSGNVLQRLYVDNFICCSSAVIRRSVYEKIGGFNPDLRMSEDFDFFLRVTPFVSVEGISEPLVHYRNHSEQASKRVEERIQVVWKIRERFNAEFGHRIRWSTRMRARSRHYAGRASRAQAAGERWQAVHAGFRAFLYNPLDLTPAMAVIRVALPDEFIAFLKKRARRRHA